MFGREAKHVQNPELDANRRRNARLEQQGKHPRNRAERRRQQLGGISARHDLDAPVAATRSERRAQERDGQAPGSSGSSASAPRPLSAKRPAPAPAPAPQGVAGLRDDAGHLHPSWAAKKLQEASLKQAHFQGKKTKFNDDDD